MDRKDLLKAIAMATGVGLAATAADASASQQFDHGQQAIQLQDTLTTEVKSKGSGHRKGSSHEAKGKSDRRFEDRGHHKGHFKGKGRHKGHDRPWHKHYHG